MPFFPSESSSFSFLLKGGVVDGKTKNLFFLVLTITPVSVLYPSSMYIMKWKSVVRVVRKTKLQDRWPYRG